MFFKAQNPRQVFACRHLAPEGKLISCLRFCGSFQGHAAILRSRATGGGWVTGKGDSVAGVLTF